ncbi:unnamed protein product [Caretta caretta]
MGKETENLEICGDNVLKDDCLLQDLQQKRKLKEGVKKVLFLQEEESIAQKELTDPHPGTVSQTLLVLES